MFFIVCVHNHRMEYKTNVMRILDKSGITYKSFSYANTNATNGMEIAAILGQNPAQVFKTLVTITKNHKVYIFMVPVCCELDLKKAAISVNEKSLDMLKSRDLLNVVGYVHGGCSPIGMKKRFSTVLDVSANNFETIIYSAGHIGYQVETTVSDLKKIVQLSFGNICV